MKIIAVLVGWLYICWFQRLHLQGVLGWKKKDLPALTLLMSVLPSLKLDRKLCIKSPVYCKGNTTGDGTDEGE